MRSTKRKVRPARRLRGRDGRGLPGTSELLNVQERRHMHASRERSRLLVPERIFRAKLPASVGEVVQLAVQWRELCWAEEESCFPARWFCRPLWGLLPVCLQQGSEGKTIKTPREESSRPRELSRRSSARVWVYKEVPSKLWKQAINKILFFNASSSWLCWGRNMLNGGVEGY